MNNPFVLPNNEYKPHFDVTSTYENQMIKAIEIQFSIGREEAKRYYDEVMEDVKVEEPLVRHYDRGDAKRKTRRKGRIDRYVTNTPITEYLTDTIDRREIMVPSFTTYISPKVDKALDNAFILENLKVRTRYKKLAKEAEMRSESRE